MAEKLTDEDIARGIEGSEWRHAEGTLVRDHEFADFSDAMRYVNAVAEVAEGENHHPDILIHGWNKVRLTLVTHSAGGITRADVDMARRLDEVEA